MFMIEMTIHVIFVIRNHLIKSLLKHMNVHDRNDHTCDICNKKSFFSVHNNNRSNFKSKLFFQIMGPIQGEVLVSL